MQGVKCWFLSGHWKVSLDDKYKKISKMFKKETSAPFSAIVGLNVYIGGVV